jgi:hypothetical protein
MVLKGEISEVGELTYSETEVLDIIDHHLICGVINENTNSTHSLNGIVNDRFTILPALYICRH